MKFPHSTADEAQGASTILLVDPTAEHTEPKAEEKLRSKSNLLMDGWFSTKWNDGAEELVGADKAGK